MKSKTISNSWLIAKLTLMPVMTALALVTFAKPETKTVSTPSAENPVMPLEDATLEEDSIYDHIDVPAHPNKVCEEAWWIEWVAQHTITPEEAVNSESLNGAFISLIVEKDGSLGPFTILRSADNALADQILRAMPPLPGSKPGNWVPAMLNGKFVRSRLILHIPSLGNIPKPNKIKVKSKR